MFPWQNPSKRTWSVIMAVNQDGCPAQKYIESGIRIKIDVCCLDRPKGSKLIWSESRNIGINSFCRGGGDSQIVLLVLNLPPPLV